MNDYEQGKQHGISLGLAYARGYLQGTTDENVIAAFNSFMESMEAFIKKEEDEE